jgi:hypothetical protein
MQKLLNTVTPATEAATIAAPASVTPRAAAIAAHNAAGFTGSFYAGLSKPRNSGIAKAPNLNTSKAAPRTYAQLTERMHKCLSEIAAKHGAASFPLIGIDRGQAAIFLASGFLTRAGESNVKLSPDTFARYTVKPAKPVKPAKA